MPPTTDIGLIRTLLETDRAWAVYALGDLAPDEFARSSWWVAAPGGPALTLLYRGFDPPVLFALGPVNAVAALITEMDAPPRLFLHVRPDHLPAVRQRYRVDRSEPMVRMVLDPSRFPAERSA